ncbi:endolytic transglycosylase MltG [Aurantibacter aestuarii]|uniref:Endolytic murein transglycosylase n=1 Tax=Aurantibacter aestuarii TaxID=1266046 RepID=A0A2T1N4T7_9FLAO|nr:endolytic transglycosylase MltG [Aurantibacter aestuarii]PSG86302.1 endolytic transglycosylase MltG [Aurantibacter aestuarii]
MYIKKILLAIALIGLVIAGYCSYYVYNTMFQPNTSFNNEEAYVLISKNDTYEDVKLQIEPLLKDIKTFDALAEQKKYKYNVKSGRYIIRKGMNNNDIINSIRSKNMPLNISFNNQERLENLAGRLAQQLDVDSLELLTVMEDPKFLAKHNFTNETAISMYVPNSYEFFWNSSAETIRSRMLKEYEAFWTPSRLKNAKAINLSKNEVVALASIVHKETAKVDERPRVAGVYLNRLRLGMPLQADPTVIYAKKKEANNFDMVIKRVLYKDLEIDSPYNTYKYGGLPPGPITMPDVSAVDAVLNAEKHDYLYFVANVENFGYHKFAKTLAQHNRNKNEYVRWINKMGINR